MSVKDWRRHPSMVNSKSKVHGDLQDDYEVPKPRADVIAKLETAGVQLELPLSGKSARSVANNLMASAVRDGGEVGEDMVHLPKHYAQYEIEPIRFIVENFGPAFLIGNIIKYVMRYRAKNGLEDLRKAARYNEMLHKYESKDPDWWR